MHAAIALSPLSPRPGARSAVAQLAALSALWWLLPGIINPIGDFPLNDDWAYGLPAQHLAEAGTLRFTNFQSMPLIVQTLWGAGWAALYGPSFTVLRFSTLVAGWAVVLMTWLLVRRVASVRWATAAAILLALNPLYLALSLTFMTDVSFTALVLGAALCFCRAWTESGRLRTLPLVCATAFSVAATLTRQLGLAVPAGFLVAQIAEIWQRTYGAADRRRSHEAWRLGIVLLLQAMLPLACAGLALLAYNRILEATLGWPELYHVKAGSAARALRDLLHLRLGMLRYPCWATFVTLHYLGLSLLPFLLWLLPRWWRGLMQARRAARTTIFICVLAAFLALASGLVLTGTRMPLAGNTLIDFGIGPRPLAGPRPAAPGGLWMATSLASALGGALFLAGLACTWRSAGPRGRRRMLFVAGVGGLLLLPPAFTYGAFFDRYLLPIIPLSLVALSAAGREQLLDAGERPAASGEVTGGRAVRVLGHALLAGYALFGVAGTHDYLEWNRQRWNAAHRLLAAGVPAEQIDGGFEFNNYIANRAAFEARAELPELIRPGGRPYQIAFGPHEGGTVLEVVPTRTWLPWSPADVCIIRHEPPGYSGGP